VRLQALRTDLILAKTETNLDVETVLAAPPSVFLQVSAAEDRRFELLRGCPNTLSNNADQRSPVFTTVRDLG